MRSFINGWWLIAVGVLTFILCYLFPFIYWPEMINYPFFLSQGWQLYRDWSSVYTPLFLYILKFFYDVFGYSFQSLKLFGVIMAVINTLLVAGLSYKVSKKFIKTIIVTIFFVMAYFAFGGNSVWFDLFLAPLILIIFYYRRYGLSAFLFGIAVVSKQTALYLLPVILKDIFKRPVALLIPVAGFFIFLAANNLFLDFYDWGVKFVFLLPKAGDVSLPTIKQLLVVLSYLVAVLFVRDIRAILFLFVTMLFAFPRFEFFHLIPFLLIFSVAISKKPWLIIFPLVPTLLLLKATFDLGNRFVEPVIFTLADDIKNNYSKKSIFSLNGPDQIYFLTGKVPAVRPWLDQLPWQLKYKESEFYDNFVSQKPDIIVTKPYLEKPVQGLGAYKPKKLWDFIESNYHVIKEYENNIFLLERN